MPSDTLQMLKRARGHPQYVLIVSVCVWSASLFLAIPTIMHSKESEPINSSYLENI